MNKLAGAAALALSLFAAVPPGSAAPARSPSFPVGCSYISGTAGLQFATHCATPVGVALSISPEVLRGLAYERDLASIAIDDRGWFYRTRDGRAMQMVTFDNGPDYFSEGFARAVIAGKLAYVDRRLHVRLRTRYDWGEPFARGRAQVCIGCIETRVDGGEHSMMTGGRWGIIDRTGREVVPVTHPRSSLSDQPG